MNIAFDKTLVRRTFSEEVIGPWVKPKGYDLSCVCLTVPALKLSLNVAFGAFEEFTRFLKDQYGEKPDHSNANGYYIQFEHEKIEWNWVLITRNDWYAKDYNTIVHELHHFVHAALGSKGVTYGSGGEEVFAYLQGYFMELMVKAFSELSKNKRRKKRV